MGFPKRFSFLLTSARFQRGPLAPSELPDFLATMGLSDSRFKPAAVIGSHSRLPLTWLSNRVSQVPLLICPCALPPLTPRSPATASTYCFIAGFRLHPYRADWPLPLRNEAETGLLVTTAARRFASRGFVKTDCSVSRSIGYMLNRQFTW